VRIFVVFLSLTASIHAVQWIASKHSRVERVIKSSSVMMTVDQLRSVAPYVIISERGVLQTQL